MSLLKRSFTAFVIVFSVLIFATGLNAQKQMALTPTAEFSLPALGYAYDALEPYIDKETMEIHHTKHHQAYVNNLNAALKNHRLKGHSLEMILMNIAETRQDIALVNHGGGHYNHSLFWEILAPGGSDMPKGKLAAAIDEEFGSFDDFVKEFSTAAGRVFGSGWAWLSVDENGSLFVSSTKNQDNPLMENVVVKAGTPILGIDVWEHAYYLKFQNRRGDYIGNFMKIVNWDAVVKKYEKTLIK